MIQFTKCNSISSTAHSYSQACRVFHRHLQFCLSDWILLYLSLFRDLSNSVKIRTVKPWLGFTYCCYKKNFERDEVKGVRRCISRNFAVLRGILRWKGVPTMHCDYLESAHIFQNGRRTQRISTGTTTFRRNFVRQIQPQPGFIFSGVIMGYSKNLFLWINFFNVKYVSFVRL